MKLGFEILGPLLGLILAPLLPGIINRVRARLSGRQGPPLMQVYLDYLKLLGKGTVCTETTTWLFRAGPMVSLAAMLTALFLVPIGSLRPPLSFQGDLLVLLALLTLERVVQVLAALDTGSALAGLGASRQVRFAALTAPAFLLGVAAASRVSGGGLSLVDIHQNLTFSLWFESGLVLGLVAGVLFVVFLCENSRIPIDDPVSSQELSLLEQVTIQAYGGPDLAFITYTRALKLWLLGSVLLCLIWPARTHDLIPVTLISASVDLALVLAGLVLLAIVTGLLESNLGRLKLNRVPQLLIGNIAVAGLALILALQQPVIATAENDAGHTTISSTNLEYARSEFQTLISPQPGLPDLGNRR